MPKHDLSHRRSENIVDCKGDWNAAEKKQKPNQNQKQKHRTTTIIDDEKKATAKATSTATAATTRNDYMKGKSKSPRNYGKFPKSSDSSDTAKVVDNHETVDKNEAVVYKDENEDKTDDLFFEERILRIVLIPILEFLADNRNDVNNFVAVNKFFTNNSKTFIRPWPKHYVLNIQGEQFDSYYWHPCLAWSKDMSTIFCTNNGYSIYVFGREKGYGGKIYTLPDTDIPERIRVFTVSPCEKMLVVATETAATPWTIRILNATKGNNYEQLKELNIPGYDDDWSHCIVDLAVSPCSKYIAIVDVNEDEEEQKARIIVYDIDGNLVATADKQIHDTNFDRYPRVMFSSDSRAVIFDDLTDSAPYMQCIKVWRPFGKVDDDDDNNDKDDGNDKGDNGNITTVGLGQFTLNLRLQISSDGTKLLSSVLDNENPTKMFHKFQVRTFTDNYKSLKLQKTVTMEYNDQHLSTIFTPDGMYALSIFNDMQGGNYDNKRSTVLNLENSKKQSSPLEFCGLSKHSFYASFSPDGTRLLTIMNGKLHMVAPIDKYNLP